MAKYWGVGGTKWKKQPFQQSAIYASPGKLNSVINNFVEQAQKYQQVVSVNGEKVKEVVFYFSSKPPQDVINRLLDIGVKVQWVPKGWVERKLLWVGILLC